MLVVDTSVLLYAADQSSEFHAPCLADVPEARGHLLHDLHAVVLMREHGVSRIVTRGRDFQRFGFLGVVDPFRVVGSAEGALPRVRRSLRAAPARARGAPGRRGPP